MCISAAPSTSRNAFKRNVLDTGAANGDLGANDDIRHVVALVFSTDCSYSCRQIFICIAPADKSAAKTSEQVDKWC